MLTITPAHISSAVKTPSRSTPTSGEPSPKAIVDMVSAESPTAPAGSTEQAPRDSVAVFSQNQLRDRLRAASSMTDSSSRTAVLTGQPGSIPDFQDVLDQLPKLETEKMGHRMFDEVGSEASENPVLQEFGSLQFSEFNTLCLREDHFKPPEK